MCIHMYTYIVHASTVSIHNIIRTSHNVRTMFSSTGGELSWNIFRIFNKRCHQWNWSEIWAWSKWVRSSCNKCVWQDAGCGELSAPCGDQALSQRGLWGSFQTQPLPDHLSRVTGECQSKGGTCTHRAHTTWTHVCTCTCTQVKAVLEEGMKYPQEHIKKFDKYQPLISREVIKYMYTMYMYEYAVFICVLVTYMYVCCCDL